MRRIFCNKLFWIVLISIEVHAIALAACLLAARADEPASAHALRPAATAQNAPCLAQLSGLKEQSTYVRDLHWPSAQPFPFLYNARLRIKSEDYFRYRFGTSHRPQGMHASDYAAFATPDDMYVKAIAQHVLMNAESERQVAMLVSVGQRIPYEYDRRVQGRREDFVRYPLETLVEDCGDCEDTAILVASLLAAAGREVVLVCAFPTEECIQSALKGGKEMPAGHVLIGIPGTKGKTIMYKGKSYTLVETTGVVPIGGIASSWNGLDWAKATIAPVKCSHKLLLAEKGKAR